MSTNEKVTSYKEQGYYVSKKLIDKDACADLYRSTVRLAAKYSSEFPLDVIDHTPWDSEEFNQAFLALRKESPNLFGAIYDSIQNSALLSYSVCNKEIINEIAEIMNCEPSGLAASGVMMRMDAPADKRNSLDWHQDSFYYNQNLSGDNGCILWFPLHDFTKDYGSIVICPESHKGGKLMVSGTGKNDYEVSEQFHVPAEEVERYSQLTVDIPCGDAIFFSMDLLHRSGHNATNKFRFTAGVRFHKMLAEDFLPGRMIYHANEKIGRLCDKH